MKIQPITVFTSPTDSFRFCQIDDTCNRLGKWRCMECGSWGCDDHTADDDICANCVLMFFMARRMKEVV